MAHIESVLSDLDLSTDNDDVTNVFNGSTFNGFAANMKAHCIDALNAMDDVEILEKVMPVKLAQVQAPAQISVDNQATWGLQAISSAPQQITNVTGFSHDYRFAADSTLGAGVDVYVLDTGVNVNHAVFQNNGQSRADITSILPSNVDDEGHGTHVSGTIAGTNVGVAPGAAVHGVKVLDAQGAGSTAGILQGLEIVANNHQQRTGQQGFIGSVINMSLGAPRSRAVNAGVQALTQMGIHVVAAAGNEAADACLFSPSSLGGTQGDVISVGSIGPTYAVSRFSNTGRCVDVFAPGEQTVSAGITSARSLQILAGTSMASPHVAGLVAYYMSANPQLAASPAQMKAFINSQSQTGVIQGQPQLRLANNGIVA
jgi:cerevisin